MVELVDSLDSGSSVHYGRAGSSPASPTKKEADAFASASFFMSGAGLEEGGLHTVQVKNMPVTYFLARGKGHFSLSAVRRTVNREKLFRIIYCASLRREHKFLGQAVGGGEDHAAAVTFSIHGEGGIVGFQDGADIAFGVIGFDLIEENVPHLVVHAQVLDFPNHFVFSHRGTSQAFLSV